MDNGFEKVDAEGSEGENLVTSTSYSEDPPTDDPVPPTSEEEDGISSSSNQPPADDSPLVDLGSSPEYQQEFSTGYSSEGSTRTMEPEPSTLSTVPGSVSEGQSASSAIKIPAKKSSPLAEATNWFENIDPRVIDLIYWRDVKKTGIVFGSVLVLLLSLALFSVLSVVAYLSLAMLTVSTTFVVYKKVLGAVQKQGDGHPFKHLLEFDVSLPEERLHEVADAVMKSSTNTIKELRRLFLVEDLVDSLKFGLVLWVLTYFGAWFNGMTLIILIVVGVFSIPKFYETYKVQIDQYLDLAKTQVNNVVKQVREKIPIGKKKEE